MHNKIDKLNLNYQNFLFYKTWEKKGKILGIHDDFGRHSFLNTKYINQLYHLDNEDRAELVLEIIELIDKINSLTETKEN